MSEPTAGKGTGRRLREIASLLVKHCSPSGLSPEGLRALFEDLGPTFVKIGQMLSSRPDMLPAPYCKELEKLRVEAEPMPIEQVRAVLEEELDAPIDEVFSSFEEQPLGSASIAQVHAAVLQPEAGETAGKAVAVKIQRPGIYETMARDIALLQRAAKMLKPIPIGEVVDLSMVLEEIWAVTQEEMDFRTEARNAAQFAANAKDIAWVSCPAVYSAYTTARLLVMERVDGIPIDAISALDATGYDRSEIGRKLAGHYVRQVLDDGFFHADPHSGNLVIREGKIVWLDFGMMGRLSPRDRKLIRKALRSIALQDVDGLVSAVLTLGDTRGTVDRSKLTADLEAFVGKYGDMDLGSMNLASLLTALMDLAMAHGIAMPGGLSLLARGIVSLEGLLSRISPDISLLEVAAQRLSRDLFHPEDWSHEIRQELRTLIDAAQRSTALPRQLSEVLQLAERGQLKVQTEHTESQAVQDAQDRRYAMLTAAILAAGCLIAAGLFSSLDAPTIAGLPWPSFVLTLSGIAAGIWAVSLAVRHRRGNHGRQSHHG